MADTGPDPAPAPAPKGILLKADTIAEPFLAEVKASLASGISRAPKLVGILATANAPSRSYAEFTRKQCVALGIEFELREVGSALGGGANGSRADGEGVEEAIIEANADDAVDGLMVRALAHTLCVFENSHVHVHDQQVYYPIFGKEQVSSLIDHPGWLLCPSDVCLSFTRDSRTTICSRSFHRTRMSRGSTISFTTISTTSASSFLGSLASHARHRRLSHQHPVSRAQIPPCVLAFPRPRPRTTQRRRPTSRNRQVDLTMHTTRRREIPRAHRGIQRAPAIRRPRLRPHDNRHQQVRLAFPSAATTTGTTSSSGPPLPDRKSSDAR
jgi:hypothetical protein